MNITKGKLTENECIVVRDFSENYRMKSFVIISECLHHDTIAVHVFHKYLVQFLKKTEANFENYLFF